ncbi:MAG: glycosyltransferase family 2 protein [bacterium]|nr:glycosyltransferase family 2 protein [bacterium]
MKSNIALLMITYNSEELLRKSLSSVKDIVAEIVVVDGGSTDETIKIASLYGAEIYNYKGINLGGQRAHGLSKIQQEWVFMLDSDEIISLKLADEIEEVVKNAGYDGYYIPYKNHFLGKPVNHGGENYKILRLARKEKIKINPSLLHEKISLTSSKTGELKNYMYHYSYRSLGQVFKKFTDYAKREAEEKYKKGERVSLKKIFLYPVHMFWARFIEDKGYKDGFFRIPLDLGFAYMELVTYIFLLQKQIMKA